MRDNRERGRINWGSLIGWIIFILIIAGSPLLNLLRSLSGGTIALPSNSIPILIGGLVVLSVIVSAIRAMNKSPRSGGDTRLPNDSDAQQRPPNAPMPPFGGLPSAARGVPVAPAPRAFTMPPNSVPTQVPQTPRFDPVINPAVIVIGVLGLLVIGGVALFVLIGNIP